MYWDDWDCFRNPCGWGPGFPPNEQTDNSSPADGGGGTPIADYLLTTNEATQNVTPGNGLLFAANNQSNGTAITHVPATSDVQLTGSGTYLVMYRTAATGTAGDTAQTELYLNGAPVAGSRASAVLADGTASELAASTLVSVPENSTSTLRLTNTGTAAEDFANSTMNIVRIA